MFFNDHFATREASVSPQSLASVAPSASTTPGHSSQDSNDSNDSQMILQPTPIHPPSPSAILFNIVAETRSDETYPEWIGTREDVERKNKFTPLEEVVTDGSIDFAHGIIPPAPSPDLPAHSVEAMLAGSLRDDNSLRRRSPGPMWMKAQDTRLRVGMAPRELSRFTYRLRHLSQDDTTRVLNLRDGMRWQDALTEVENKAFWYNLSDAQQAAFRRVKNLYHVIGDTLEDETEHGEELKEAFRKLASSPEFREVADPQCIKLLQSLVVSGTETGSFNDQEYSTHAFWYKVVELLTVDRALFRQPSTLRLARRLAVLRAMNIRRIQALENLQEGSVGAWLDIVGDREREKAGLYDRWDFWSVWTGWEPLFWKADQAYCKLTWEEADDITLEQLKDMADGQSSSEDEDVDEDVA